VRKGANKQTNRQTTTKTTSLAEVTNVKTTSKSLKSSRVIKFRLSVRCCFDVQTVVVSSVAESTLVEELS